MHVKIIGAVGLLLLLATAVTAQNWKPNLPPNYYTSFRLRTSLSDELGKGAIFSNPDAGLLRVELIYMQQHLHDTVRNQTLYHVIGPNHAEEQCKVFSLLVSPSLSWWWTKYLFPQGYDTSSHCWKFGVSIYGASITTCLRTQNVLTYFKVNVAGRELEMTTNAFWPSSPSVTWFPIDAACKGVAPATSPAFPFDKGAGLSESKLSQLPEELEKVKSDPMAFARVIWSVFFL